MEHEPVTVPNLVGSIQRYAAEALSEEHSRRHRISWRQGGRAHHEAETSKGAGQGLRTTSKAAASLNKQEIDTLWESGVYSLETGEWPLAVGERRLRHPLGLLRILFFAFTMNFGMQSGEEHRNLRWKTYSSKLIRMVTSTCCSTNVKEKQWWSNSIMPTLDFDLFEMDVDY